MTSRAPRQAAALAMFACALALATVGTPARAGAAVIARGDTPTSNEAPAPARLPPAYARSLAIDQRLQDIGWKLARANAPFCDRKMRAVGLQIQDAASFQSPGALRAALGSRGDFTIRTVAAGSPAARAGLRPHQEVVAILAPGLGPLAQIAARARGDWRRSLEIHRAMENALDASGTLTLTLADGRSVTLVGEESCATRFEVADGNARALADGERVIVGERFPAFDEAAGYGEDEVAAAIAHELAHNLLAHRAWFDAHGRKQRHVRMSENEADRLMPWLLANAGYPPEAAARFMARWGPRHSGGWLLRARSHAGWDERLEAIEAETRLVQQWLAREGVANWRRHFRRELPLASPDSPAGTSAAPD